MYEISVRQHFDAAHYLRDYNGRCENLHGHRYEVAVSLSARGLDASGLAFDFTRLKRVLKERFLDVYDHVCLNDVAPYDRINPSAENIARTMFEGLSEHLADPESQASLHSVTVWESPDSWCTYTAD
ncbi:MAG: 6-carboxytetrahydropterin synthase QueD [Chloroflexi bacterium]|nr:6-carboxytetrahydropterin synthase QueD [Chloroflexota bacterium]MCL5108213.1 6-carboxytetrahydropterin synthase QueD [Chloroflexota bacterium]